MEICNFEHDPEVTSLPESYDSADRASLPFSPEVENACVTKISVSTQATDGQIDSELRNFNTPDKKENL